MQDSIIREIRRLRAKRSNELNRNWAKAVEDSQRRAFALASGLVQTGPYTCRATFKLPDATSDKRINRKDWKRRAASASR